MGWIADLFSRNPRKQRTVDCSFCGRSNVDAGPLVEGPGDAFICKACCERFTSQLAAGTTIGRCSFCRRQSSNIGQLAGTNRGILICTECVDLATSILEQEHQRRTERTKGK